MPFTKDYYPLTPRKGRYKEPETVYLYIEMTGSVFEAAAAIDAAGLRYFQSLRDAIVYIAGLPGKTWVITYGLDFWAASFAIIPDVADSVSGLGGDRLTGLDVVAGKNHISIIDASAFFGDSLQGALRKSGLPDLYCQPTGKYKQGLKSYVANRITGVMQLWERFRDAIRSVYGVHPSRTPGATALKTFRTSMFEPLSVRGKPFTSFCRDGILPGYLYWKPGYYPDAYAYDINGSYPSVMRSIRYPLNFAGFSGSAPRSGRWIATVKINYSSFKDFSPLMVRSERGYFHPIKATNLLITLSYIDALTLQAGGELEITEWVEGVSWSAADERPLFSNWVNQIENHNSRYPDDRAVLKIMSRSLHSKFAQRPGMRIVEYCQVSPSDVMSDQGQIKELFITDSGKQIAKIEYIKPPEFQPYIRPDIELLTAAAARYTLYSSIDSNTVYSDTDSIISTVPRPDLPIGVNFGEWKNAGVGPLWVVGPRLYRMGEKTKAAGLRAVDYGELREGIANVRDNKPIIVSAVENPTMLHPDRATATREHTLQKSDYIYGDVTGDIFQVYETGEKIQISAPGRFFSIEPERRKLRY